MACLPEGGQLGVCGICGEQQRVGFARVVPYRPDGLFLEETTSALDEDTERAPYAVAHARLPGITVIWVAHRPGVEAVRRRQLTLHPETRSIENELVRTAIG